MDQKIESLRRAAGADPTNEAAALALIQARARIEGSQLYFEPLQNRLLWNQTLEPIQDLAIKQVDSGLAPAFKHLFTKMYSCGGESHRIATFKHLKTGVELNLIPGGRFMMGERAEWEKPIHEVNIERPFLLARFPLLQKEWDLVGGKDQRQHRGEGLPLENVSWNDAQDWLGKVKEGLRLPSESEGEYACRAGTETNYYWGDAMDPSRCWHHSNSGDMTHSPSEHFRAGKWNAFGLVDMLGNVSEWCQDTFQNSYKGAPNDCRPWEEEQCPNRVLRGASWHDHAPYCHSGRRGRGTPDTRHNLVGLRLSRSWPRSFPSPSS